MIFHPLSFLTSLWFPSRYFVCSYMLKLHEQSICQVCLKSLPRAHSSGCAVGCDWRHGNYWVVIISCWRDLKRTLSWNRACSFLSRCWNL